MKNLIVYFFICAVLVGCDKDDAESLGCPVEFSAAASTIANPSPAKYPCDYITAQKNGKKWTMHSTATFGIDNDTLYVFASGTEETLGFKLLFNGMGTYQIPTVANNQTFRDHAYYYTTIGGDVIVSKYVLARQAAVEITEYNETEKIIKGNFGFQLNELEGSSSVNFTEGSFSVHLPD